MRPTVICLACPKAAPATATARHTQTSRTAAASSKHDPSLAINRLRRAARRGRRQARRASARRRRDGRNRKTLRHRGARRRLPHFAFEYCDGGSGKDDAGIKRNWAGLDAVELVPRYGVMPSLPPCEVELFGRRYAAPIGVAPMGGPAVVWPGRRLRGMARKRGWQVLEWR